MLHLYRFLNLLKGVTFIFRGDFIMDKENSIAHLNNDQEDLIHDERKEAGSKASGWFALFKILPVFTSILGVSKSFFHIITLTIVSIDFVLSKVVFGKVLIGITYKIGGSQDSCYSFDINAEEDMPPPTLSNIFWVGSTLPLFVWFIILIFTSIFQTIIYPVVYCIIIGIQILNLSIFLKGNALAARQSAEQVRTVLLGNIEAFEELPEQATIQSVTKNEKEEEIKSQNQAKSIDNQIESKNTGINEEKDVEKQSN